MAFRRLGDYIVRYLGIGGASGDASNPLSVRGPGALFDGNTGGHQVRINKSIPGDTASFLFQTGFSGRAEFGTLGSDNFGLKVSTDGSAFTDVFTVSGTGSATFQQDTLFSGGVGIGGASPDATNRLSVNSEAALFNNAGSDVRLTLNKAAVSDDAALTYQDGFSTRALLGLLANDDWTLKVSPDGSAFNDAIVVDNSSGVISFPSGSTLFSFDEVNIPDGNQTINVNNASDIVGFTLMTSQNSLSSNTGVMCGTWFVGQDRSRVRCYIQTLEDPYVKFLVCTVAIDNTAGTLTISNKTARYWTITAALPQSTMSNNVTHYRLDKVILLYSKQT